MSLILTEQVRRILRSGTPAHLVTLNPDGSPQVSVVRVGLDGDEIVCGHVGEWRKVGNIRRDARVALSMLTDHQQPRGFPDYLVITGTARVTDGGAAQLLRRLAHDYLGAHALFPADELPAGHVTHIRPDHISRPELPGWAPNLTAKS